MSEALPPFRDGAVHVMARKCSTCVFRPGNLVGLRPGRLEELIATNLAADTAFTCHQVIGQAEALCRGYVDVHWRDVTPLRLARRLGLMRDVEPPAGH